MKKFILLLMFVLAVGAVSAQKYTVRRDSARHTPKENYETAKPPQFHIDRSGRYLQKSANCQLTSVSLSALSALSFVIAANNTKERAVFNTVGVITLTTAVGFQYLSVAYKFRAGTELRLSATGLALTF